ncbi:helix-turn-helix domain-containing protein [Actinomadura rugatobispora]|uniref:Helix-turn-helix domain-containing protein n=1 Tax=Actinomadura rugatobispora TaxID=1994 RepID=A0ABW0ZP13_9ACTN|nr:helix-turn-helix transcriptional regulator [Actinomadura rugatobispora]
MTGDYRGPNINARRLGLYLQRTREIVGLSYEEAAARTGCESDWLVRVETGFAPPAPAEVERLLERYEVREAKVAELMIDLASRPDGPPWLAGRTMKAEARDALISESEACVVHTYGFQKIPDLAQAEEYARFVASVQIMECDEEAEWELLDHRRRFRAGGRRRFLDVIVDEHALTLPVKDPKVMRAQLRHLLELGESPDARVRVVPDGALFYEDRAHPFDVLEFPGISDRISLIHTILGIGLARGDLTDLWETIEEKSAASPEESRTLLQTLLEERTTG